MTDKTNVLLIGAGGVGTMAAYNLEAGGQASVTAVLRSNYSAVKVNGFTITSIDHGFVKEWRPTHILHSVPDVSNEGSPIYDVILVTTKNVPDISPMVVELIYPAVTPNHTSIVLLQNGLNIELPIIAAFPTNPVISGVSLIGATETSPGHIVHDDRDRILVGAFHSPISQIPEGKSIAAAKVFASLYSASGKVSCTYDSNVAFSRWRKLIYNATYNGVCAITGMDTSRMRMAGFPIEDVIRPLMWEIWRIARAKGHELPESVIQDMIDCDPWDTYFKPSMQQDIEKGNFIEFENIVGEPLREAEKLGIPAPGLNMLYGLLKIKQLQIKESKGLVILPAKGDPTRPMLQFIKQKDVFLGPDCKFEAK
ncbi:2-dehydropantoate 2-reductase [Amylocarpus encephaloides]|uniref:2-dehydropantoate 2-reductase n=1 Tax=Amylocarpus encephaloides TaxID=45428 RepID=A0A9P7YTS4_9HELO|nr:2-dehydropantoate 2-reductase [Amylocarpus encephaloides]